MPHWPNLRRCYQNEVYLKQDDAFNLGEISIPIGDATADKQLELGQEPFYPCCSFYLQGNLIWPCPSPPAIISSLSLVSAFLPYIRFKSPGNPTGYVFCVCRAHTHTYFCLSESFFFLTSIRFWIVREERENVYHLIKLGPKSGAK